MRNNRKYKNMKILSKKACFTPSLERKWASGEVAEVDEKTAKELLRNKNFVSVNREMKAETSENNVNKYRTKKINRLGY